MSIRSSRRPSGSYEGRPEVGCDKAEGGGKAADSTTAKSTAAATRAPAKKDSAQLVKELADPATRKAAKEALISYEWNKVAGGGR